MKFLIDFLDSSDITRTTIYPHLKCELDEALMLQSLSRRYIDGIEDAMGIEILSELYGVEKYEYLKHLSKIKNLLELGWINLNSLLTFKIADLNSLELLNSSISLSAPFLRLLEEGALGESENSEIKAYHDHLEYLQDQFYKVELYQKMVEVRENAGENSLGLTRLQAKLVHLEERIALRLESGELKIPLAEFLEKHKFDTQEELIFLALLKEEYNAGDVSIREMNALIDLISIDEYGRIKNRSYLEDGSRLLGDEILEYEEMLSPFGGITRAFFIHEEILQSIIHPQKKKKVRTMKLDMLVKDQDTFELHSPGTTLDDVVLNEKTRKTLNNLLMQMDKEVVARLVEWGIKDKKSGMDARIIFYGPAGTGKTMSAYSLAKSLKRQVLSFDCSKILSMYVGESEKNVRNIFDSFHDLSTKSKVEPILLLNEADQFLSARSSGPGGGAEQMHNQMQNIFLEQIENFSGILIATTNLLENIDTAFSRRFNYKIAFARPTKVQRAELWEKMLPRNAPYEKNFKVEKLHEYDLSGGQINLVIKNTAYAVATKEEPLFKVDDFIYEIEREKNGDFDSEKQLGFL